MHPNFYCSPVNVFVLWLSGYDYTQRYFFGAIFVLSDIKMSFSRIHALVNLLTVLNEFLREFPSFEPPLFRGCVTL